MKLNLFDSLRVETVGLAFLALAATASADIEDNITRVFKAQPGGQLVVDLDRGSIEIKTAEGESVDIEITRQAGGRQSTAEKTLKDHVVTTTQTDRAVEIRAEYKGAQRRSWFGRSPELQVHCRIIVPPKFDVDLKTSGGHIKVAELTGKVRAHTSGGNMTFEKIEGPVSAHTSGGSLNLSDIQGDVDAQTSGGSIHAGKLTGRSVVKTSGGNVEVAGIKGQIDARTSGGSVTAKLLEQPAGDCTFTTSGGNVTVVLDAKVAVDVNARTSAGRVSTDFPVVAVIQGEQKKNELRGKINGGGPLITAHTSGGSVRLRKN